MKIIKWLFRLIILGLLATLVYQNVDYFLTKVSLSLNLKISNWQWTFPDLQNWVYFVTCFLIGVIWVGFNWMLSSHRLKKDIKIKSSSIDSLKAEVNTLKTELEVFKHDPYIKSQLDNRSSLVQEDVLPEKDVEISAENEVPVESKEEKAADA